MDPKSVGDIVATLVRRQTGRMLLHSATVLLLLTSVLGKCSVDCPTGFTNMSGWRNLVSNDFVTDFGFQLKPLP